MTPRILDVKRKETSEVLPQQQVDATGGGR